jgi:hypothetical protein
MLGDWLSLVVGVENMCSYGRAPGFLAKVRWRWQGPLAKVESRRALKLFSELALIILSGAIRLLKIFFRVGYWIDWTWSRFL